MDPSADGGLFVVRDDRDLRLAPAEEVADRLALLAAVNAGQAPSTLRLLRPEPTAAFSRRDALLPGYPAAVEAARRHGFVPALRPVGGRMAPYHRGCLVLDVAGATDDPRAGMVRRFVGAADVVVDVLRGMGLDARVGPLPGEYCPGEHSVNLGGVVKVAGTAQRQTRRAWLVSVLLVVDDAPEAGPPLRAVTTDVYAALGLELDPATVGSVRTLEPGATVGGVAERLLDRVRSAGVPGLTSEG